MKLFFDLLRLGWRFRHAINFFWLIGLAWRAWTAPNTPAAGSVLSASDWATYVRDNLNYLLQRPLAKLYYTAADKTTSSTTYVAVDSTNVKVTLPILNSGRVFFFMSCKIQQASGAVNLGVDFQMDIDGTKYEFGSMSLIASGSPFVYITLTGVVDGLSVGSHTFTPYWKVSGDSATIKGASAIPIILVAMEV